MSIYKTFTITDEVPLVATETEGRKVHAEAGASWSIQSIGTSSETAKPVSVVVHCRHRPNQLLDWSIDATIDVKVFHPTNPELVRTATLYEKTFANRTPTVNVAVVFDDAHPLEQYVTPESGGGTVRVEATLRILKMCGVMAERDATLFDRKRPTSDVVIRIGDTHRFYVSRAMLAVYSHVFASTLHGDFLEGGQPEIEVKGQDPEVFREMLYVIYDQPYITTDNMWALAQIIDFYDHKKAREILADHVARCSEEILSFALKVQFADEFQGYELLMMSLLSALKSPEDVQAANLDMSSLSERTRASIEHRQGVAEDVRRENMRIPFAATATPRFDSNGRPYRPRVRPPQLIEHLAQRVEQMRQAQHAERQNPPPAHAGPVLMEGLIGPIDHYDPNRGHEDTDSDTTEDEDDDDGMEEVEEDDGDDGGDDDDDDEDLSDVEPMEEEEPEPEPEPVAPEPMPIDWLDAALGARIGRVRGARRRRPWPRRGGAMGRGVLPRRD